MVPNVLQLYQSVTPIFEGHVSVRPIFEITCGLPVFVVNEKLSLRVVRQQSKRNTDLNFQGKRAVVSIPLEIPVFLIVVIESTF